MKIWVTVIYEVGYNKARDHIRVFMNIGYTIVTPVANGSTIVNSSTPFTKYFSVFSRLFKDST